MTAPASVDPTRCPLCGAANACAMEVARETGVAQPPCWCMSATFTAALIDSVPAPARGTACICAACAARAATASSASSLTEITTPTP
ncbi:cysteine-rich CWC family protein [Variovorax rhizosphaerae]|uniref:Cysteine-rich CWC family protein n=1 Tax=Variovorax rhizosphaerae TaxID=1836200 RepID=A0ABU8WPL5_9BURK